MFSISHVADILSFICSSSRMPKLRIFCSQMAQVPPKKKKQISTDEIFHGEEPPGKPLGRLERRKGAQEAPHKRGWLDRPWDQPGS